MTLDVILFDEMSFDTTLRLQTHVRATSKHTLCRLGRALPIIVFENFCLKGLEASADSSKNKNISGKQNISMLTYVCWCFHIAKSKVINEATGSPTHCIANISDWINKRKMNNFSSWYYLRWITFKVDIYWVQDFNTRHWK